MPDCPNCGLSTLRTKDWVCQWCGYPLVSNSYKVIDKTYKELQDERRSTLKPSSASTTPQSMPEYRPEPEPRNEQQEKPVVETRPTPVSPPQPRPETASSSLQVTPVQSKPEIVTPPASATPAESLPDVAEPVESVTPAQPQPVVETPPVYKDPPSQPNKTPPPPPQSDVAPESNPQVIPSTPKTPLRSASKPEFVVEPEPEPLPRELLLEPEDIEDGMEIAVEQIDAIFKTQQEAANAAFTGKTFIIQGIVEKVFIRDHLDIRYILLTGIMKGITWSLRCTFERENAKALTGLQEGQAVKIQGTYDSVGKNIIFKDCALD